MAPTDRSRMRSRLPRPSGGFADTWAARAAGERSREVEDRLARADPGLGRLIERVVAQGGPRRYPVSNAASHFDALVRSIVYQQLSKKAAATIYGRYREVVGAPAGPRQVLAARTRSLRRAGLSRPKIAYLQALARAIVDGQLDLDRIDRLADQEIVERLTAVPGIGVWTAQMFLMFRLRRPDVLPTGDLGIRRGVQLAHRLRQLATPAQVARVGQRWAPYRSVACLYLWAALDLGADRQAGAARPGISSGRARSARSPRPDPSRCRAPARSPAAPRRPRTSGCC